MAHCRNLEHQINKNNVSSELVVQLETKCKNLQQQLNETLQASKLQQQNSLSNIENKFQQLQDQLIQAKQWEIKCCELQEKLSEMHNQGKLKLEQKIKQIQTLENNYKKLEIDLKKNIDILNDLQKDNKELMNEVNELRDMKNNFEIECQNHIKNLKIAEDNYKEISERSKNMEQKLAEFESLKVAHNQLVQQNQEMQEKSKGNKVNTEQHVKIIRKAQEYKRRYNEARSELETITAKLKESELVGEQRENDLSRLEQLLEKAEPAQERLRDVEKHFEQLKVAYETERSEKMVLNEQIIALEAHCQQQQEGK